MCVLFKFRFYSSGVETKRLRCVIDTWGTKVVLVKSICPVVGSSATVDNDINNIISLQFGTVFVKN